MAQQCGIDLGAAREKIRVAHALEALPRISEAFRTGRVSFSKVRAMTRVATPVAGIQKNDIARNQLVRADGTPVTVAYHRRPRRRQAAARRLRQARVASTDISWAFEVAAWSSFLLGKGVPRCGLRERVYSCG